jgi:hypothetical protein
MRRLVKELLERLVTLEYQFGQCVLEPLGALRTACKKENGAAAKEKELASAHVEVGVKKLVACIGQLADLLQVSHQAAGSPEATPMEDEFSWLRKAQADLTLDDPKAIGLAETKELASEFSRSLREVVVAAGALEEPIGMQLPTLSESEWVEETARHAETLGIPGAEAVQGVLLAAKATLSEAFNGLVEVTLQTAKDGVAVVQGCVRETLAAAADQVLGPLQSVFGEELMAELFAVTQDLAAKLGSQYFEKLMRYASPQVYALTTGKNTRPAASHIREVAVWSVQRIVHSLESTVAANTPSQSSTSQSAGHTQTVVEIIQALEHALCLAREMNKHDKVVRSLFEGSQLSAVHSQLNNVARSSEGALSATNDVACARPASDDFLANLPVGGEHSTDHGDSGGGRASWESAADLPIIKQLRAEMEQELRIMLLKQMDVFNRQLAAITSAKTEGGVNGELSPRSRTSPQLPLSSPLSPPSSSPPASPPSSPATVRRSMPNSPTKISHAPPGASAPAAPSSTNTSCRWPWRTLALS